MLQAVGTTDKLIRSKFGSMLTAEKALNWKRIFDNADAPVRDERPETVIPGRRKNGFCRSTVVCIERSQSSGANRRCDNDCLLRLHAADELCCKLAPLYVARAVACCICYAGQRRCTWRYVRAVASGSWRRLRQSEPAGRPHAAHATSVGSQW